MMVIVVDVTILRSWNIVPKH